MKLSPDEKYMRAAYKEALKAYALGEVPIGSVIVCEDKIIARGYNRRNTDKSTLSHAELTAIKKAAKKQGDWRLEGCTIYVTLEPCPMCAGAIVQSRMDRCVIGTASPKSGSAGSIVNLLNEERFNHQVEVEWGILEDECASLLQKFFKELRVRVKEERLKEDHLKKED